MSLDLAGLAELARTHLPGALFVTVSGAHLYGFPSTDSDVDLRGFTCCRCGNWSDCLRPRKP